MEAAGIGLSATPATTAAASPTESNAKVSVRNVARGVNLSQQIDHPHFVPLSAKIRTLKLWRYPPRSLEAIKRAMNDRVPYDESGRIHEIDSTRVGCDGVHRKNQREQGYAQEHLMGRPSR
jgi:hypothetical protein